MSRDRCGLFAQAAREGAPQARQMDDRLHLMQNLGIAIEEQMSLSGRATGRALLPDKDIGSAQVDLFRIRTLKQRIGAGYATLIDNRGSCTPEPAISRIENKESYDLAMKRV